MDIFYFISVVYCHIEQKAYAIEGSGAIRGGNGAMPPEIYFFRAPTGIGAPRVKGPQEVAPNKGPMQTRGSCRQGALQIKGPYTDKGPPRSRSSYIQGSPTDKKSL